MQAETAPIDSAAFSGQSVHVPLRVRSARLAGLLRDLARLLMAEDTPGADAAWRRIVQLPEVHEAQQPDTGSESIAPTQRTKAIASVLRDLARSGWGIAVEDDEIYVNAPAWSAGASGMSPERVSAEKERARAAMAGRVDEEINTDGNARFILRMERASRTELGAHSILSYMADGSSLAATLRERGAEAIQPYLQRADADAGCDEETGIALSDVFRYFRLLWSFPTKAPPGRSLNFLVRDAGQPGSPVCGLICVASPVPRLSARDSALGWSPAWLESAVALVDLPVEDRSEHVARVVSAARSRRDSGLDVADLLEHACRLLKIPLTRAAETFVARVGALQPRELQRRCAKACNALLEDLRREILGALDGISFAGFPITRRAALARPAHASSLLLSAKAVAYRQWHDSRRVTASGQGTSRASHKDLSTKAGLKAAAQNPLYYKKRVTKASSLLRAWADLVPEREENPRERLRQLVYGPLSTVGRLTGGERAARGVRAALLERQSRFVASQVADVCVCGAIPPYGPLLGGKLAALAALSREIAAEYHARYDGRASEISSQMAADVVCRPADLVALTTTSFFGVGSSQYERLALPVGEATTKWRFVGFSGGHGTLHFSNTTSDMIDALLRFETGRRLITSRFGEGPSERLRKIRDGLARLGISPNVLLQHGMPRRVYVATVADAACFPGASQPTRPWRLRAPKMRDVAAFWRERWLQPRLTQSPHLIEVVSGHTRESILLSRRLKGQDA